MTHIPRVFISSTVEDLRDYRLAAHDAAMHAEFFPSMQEYFPAGNNPPLAECLERVRRCDLLVVLVAHRYGWVPADQSSADERSITWLECLAAVDAGMEVLALLVDTDASWPDERRDDFALTAAIRAGKIPTLADIERVKRNVQKLAEFKAWLMTRAIVSMFGSPDDLKARVNNALHAWLLRHPSTGTSSDGLSAKVDPGPYLKGLLAENSLMEIKGLNVGDGKVHSVPIEDLFITLRTLHGGDQHKSSKRGSNDSGKRQSIDSQGGSSVREVPSRGD